MSIVALGDIVGQDRAIDQLQRSMNHSRLPHAFLFAGPSGVGRRTTAIAFAQLLLCENPTTQPADGDDSQPFRQACGQCHDCRMMQAESHGDFHMIYKELARYHDDAAVRQRKMQELSIDVIRQFLIAPAGRAPTRGQGKIFIVLEAELMNFIAQNALLKTLEEPPAGVRIILISEKPDMLLPTTLSRCAMVRFSPLPHAFVADRLKAGGVEAGEASFWAAFTNGSIGRATRMQADGMYEIKCDMLDRLGQLGPGGDVQLSEYLAGAANKLADAAISAAKALDGSDLSKLLAARRAAGTMLGILASAFRDALTLATAAQREIIHGDQPHVIEAMQRRFTPLQIAEILESLSQYERLLWRNVNPKTVWDNVVITCASGSAQAV